MALIRINAEGRRPVLHGTDAALLPELTQALPDGGPITVMLHGYKFAPHEPAHCPHNHIFALGDVACRKGISWPQRLGYLDDTDESGLGIAFGWQARGSLKSALRSAVRASHALAELIKTLRHRAPHRPVNLIGHSMGAYVALGTLSRLNSGDIGRIILLNGAVFRPCAAAALRTNAGRTAELFNVVSRENAFYDLLFERMLGRTGAHDRSVGRGFEAPNALTVRLDDNRALKRLSALGYDIAPTQSWLCHWSSYLRPGALEFYNALLRTPGALPMRRLQVQLTPRGYLATVRPPLQSRTCSTA